MYDSVLTQDLSKLPRDKVGAIIGIYYARPSGLLDYRKICTCSGNGTESRTVQGLLCLVDLYFVFLI